LPIKNIDFQVIDQFGTIIGTRLNVVTVSDQMWHYMCVNLYNAFTQTHGSSYTAASLILHQVWVSEDVTDLYIDAVSVRRAIPLGYASKLILT
jgi:hypothetical protein